MKTIYSRKMKTAAAALALVLAALLAAGIWTVVGAMRHLTFSEALHKVPYIYSTEYLYSVAEKGHALLANDMLAVRIGDDGNTPVDITDIYSGKIDRDTSYKAGDLRKYYDSDAFKALSAALVDLNSGAGIWEDKEIGQYFYRAEDGTILATDDNYGASNISEFYVDEGGIAESDILYVVKNSDGDTEPYSYSRGRSGHLNSITRAQACAYLMDLPKGTDIGNLSEKTVYLCENAAAYETVLPVSGTSLYEQALRNPGKAPLENLYGDLVSAARRTASAYMRTKSTETVPAVYYYCRDKVTGKVITNRPAWRESGFEELQRKLDVPFIACDNSPAQVQNGQPALVPEESMLDPYEAYDAVRAGELGDREIIYAMNEAVAADVPAYADSMSRWFIPALIAVILGGLGILAMIVVSMVQAARRPEDEEKHPCVYAAKCPVELMLLIDTLAWAAACAVTGGVFVLNIDTGLMLPILICLFAACTGMALGTLVPLASKIKSRCLGKNSIILWLIRKARAAWHIIYGNRKASAKALITVLIFLVINLIIVCCGALPLLIIPWLALLALAMWKAVQKNTVMKGIEKIAGGDLEFRIDTGRLKGDELKMAEDMNEVKKGMRRALDSQIKSERMKTDLIANVSHDIRTPLTSIINYVDLLKKEDIDNEKAREYIEVLDRKSQRLKQLTEDLVEASRISSGNIELEMSKIDLKELIMQIQGEFYQKFTDRDLTVVCRMTEESMVINGDGKRIYRVLENLYTNAVKYSMPGSRVYIDGGREGGKVVFTIRNMSENELNMSADELMERFVRGDVSRNTEGSGLGLEIARNLTFMMWGDFDLRIDGDLFKVTLSFPEA